MTLQRFPFTLTTAIIGTAVTIALVEQEQTLWLQRLLLTCVLGVPLFTALVSFAELRAWPSAKKISLQAVALVLLVIYYVMLSPNPFEPWHTVVRFILLGLGLHFLVAFLPFVGREREAGFWEYNKTLFLRFLLAALYSAVLYAGLAIALAAADHLFGAHVPGERYAQLWVLIVGVFNTWVFLAGVPADRNQLTSAREYPKGLKVFTQFILLPLVGLYFLILIAYEIKIIAVWEWPKGWVSELVLWFSVVGILSLLLLHPLRNKSGSTWVTVFGRWFFRAIVPLVVLLFLAILVRIGDYGFTPPRYFVLAMAVGLSVVTLYFIFSRQKDIRIIPMVLCALAFISAYGPWSAFAVSERSQVGRLEQFSSAYVAAEQEQAKTDIDETAQDDTPANFNSEASNIISHLVDWYGVSPWEDHEAFAPLVTQDTLSSYQLKEQVATTLGFDYYQPYRRFSDKTWFNYSTYPYTPISPQPGTDIAGFDRLVRVYGIANGSTYHYDFVVQDETWQLAGTENGDVRVVRADTATHSVEVLARFPLRSLIDQYWPQTVEKQFVPHELQIDADSSALPARLVVFEVNGYYYNDSLEINNLYGLLLFDTE